MAYRDIEKLRAYSAKASRRLRAKDPERNRTKNKEWRDANPEKHLAHKAVEAALRRGELSRMPCERCGKSSIVHAHHDDYTRRLDVMWLCHVHHRERHDELREMSRLAEAA